MSRRASFVVLVAIAGCSLRPFRNFEANTPTTSMASTSAFPSQTFGTLLASYQVSTGGHELSRILVATGPLALSGSTTDGIVGDYSFWEDGKLAKGDQIYAVCGGTSGNCPDDVGASIAPIRDFDGGHGCLLAGAPASPTPEAVVICESSTRAAGTSINRYASPAAPTDRFGASVQAIPVPATPIGVAFLGAPAANTVYVMAEDTSFSPLSLGGFAPSATAEFGSDLATAPIAPIDPAIEATLPPSDARTLLAVSAPGENRVYLFFARNLAANGNDALLVGCVDGPRSMPTIDDGFGTTLLAGDLNADGMPEVVIGASINAPMRNDQVSVVSLADIDFTAGAPVGCADPSPADDPKTRVLPCPADPAMHVSCDGFGASLAIGDADGSPEQDLLVGAPLANVGNTAHAGAAFLFPGNQALDAFVAPTNTPARLFDSSPGVNDTLGLAVTFARSELVVTSVPPRDEPVASAPGANRVFMFLCSGLPNDSISDGHARCIVEE